MWPDILLSSAIGTFRPTCGRRQKLQIGPVSRALNAHEHSIRQPSVSVSATYAKALHADGRLAHGQGEYAAAEQRLQVSVADLAALRRRREWPVRVVQVYQQLMQHWMMAAPGGDGVGR